MNINDLLASEMRFICVPSQSKLNEDMIKSLDDLFNIASPDQYRDALVRIYHAYIVHEHQALPVNFQEMAKTIADLTEFLDRCRG